MVAVWCSGRPLLYQMSFSGFAERDCLNILSHQGLLAAVKNVSGEAHASVLCCYLCHVVCVLQQGIHDYLLLRC